MESTQNINRQELTKNHSFFQIICYVFFICCFILLGAIVYFKCQSNFFLPVNPNPTNEKQTTLEEQFENLKAQSQPQTQSREETDFNDGENPNILDDKFLHEYKLTQTLENDISKLKKELENLTTMMSNNQQEILKTFKTLDYTLEDYKVKTQDIHKNIYIEIEKAKNKSPSTSQELINTEHNQQNEHDQQSIQITEIE